MPTGAASAMIWSYSVRQFKQEATHRHQTSASISSAVQLAHQEKGVIGPASGNENKEKHQQRREERERERESGRGARAHTHIHTPQERERDGAKIKTALLQYMEDRTERFIGYAAFDPMDATVAVWERRCFGTASNCCNAVFPMYFPLLCLSTCLVFTMEMCVCVCVYIYIYSQPIYKDI